MRVLVTAASKHGSTAEMAEWMGEAFRAVGVDTTVLAPDAVASVDVYDAVVLGSGAELGQTPVAVST